ncbi:MAG: GAF domain-containing protein [Anaerolineaceae bacterium]|nr:GAF domain-containing protein [Anaerolineaceae bacterium]
METVRVPENAPICHYTHISCSTKQYADELETLLTIQQAITSRLDLSDVLTLIAEAAQRLTSAQLSLLYVLDGADLRIAAVSGQINPDDLIGYHIPVNHSVAGLSIKTSHAIAIQDVRREDARLYREAVKRFGDVRSYMTVPLISGTRPLGVIAVADQSEAVLEADRLRVLGMLASSAVIGLENARLYQEQQDRRLEAESRHQMAEGLRVMLAILNSTRSMDEILDYIVKHVSGRLLDCQAMAIYSVQPHSQALAVQAAHGLPASLMDASYLLKAQDTVRRAVSTRQPVALADAAEILEDETSLEMATTEWSLVGQLVTYFQSWLAVPLIVKGEIYGAVLMYYRQRQSFSEEQIGLATAFCDQVALAIENARLRMQAERAAVLAERNRLARELHDAVSQTLLSTSLIAEVLPRLWDKNQAEGRRRLEELRQLTRGALAEMRTLLFELRPSALMEARLGDLFKHLTQAISSRTGIPIALTIEGDRILPPDVQVALYRITQEALNNVAKYANPSQTSVKLRCCPDQVMIAICDNGCGFDPGCVSSEHLGLKIMYERAAAVQASLKLTSKPGCGTQIEVVWPESPTQE